MKRKIFCGVKGFPEAKAFYIKKEREDISMSKKLLSVLLSTAMVAALLVGCGTAAAEERAAATAEAAPEAEAPAEEAEAPAEDAEEAPAAATGTKVGVSMPTKDLQR